MNRIAVAAAVAGIFGWSALVVTSNRAAKSRICSFNKISYGVWALIARYLPLHSFAQLAVSSHYFQHLITKSLRLNRKILSHYRTTKQVVKELYEHGTCVACGSRRLKYHHMAVAGSSYPVISDKIKITCLECNAYRISDIVYTPSKQDMIRDGVHFVLNYWSVEGIQGTNSHWRIYLQETGDAPDIDRMVELSLE